MLMRVKPGMVLTSLRKMRCFSVGLHEEIDTGEAGEVAGAEGRHGHCADLLGLRAGELGGNDRHRALGEILGLVVVELLAGNDFADDAGLGRVVAEDGDFELAGLGFFAADALFDHQLAVVAGGQSERGAQFLAVVRLADADRGAQVCGLDEERDT